MMKKISIHKAREVMKSAFGPDVKVTLSCNDRKIRYIYIKVPTIDDFVFMICKISDIDIGNDRPYWVRNTEIYVLLGDRPLWANCPEDDDWGKDLRWNEDFLFSLYHEEDDEHQTLEEILEMCKVRVDQLREYVLNTKRKQLVEAASLIRRMLGVEGPCAGIYDDHIDHNVATHMLSLALNHTQIKHRVVLVKYLNGYNEGCKKRMVQALGLLVDPSGIDAMPDGPEPIQYEEGTKDLEIVSGHMVTANVLIAYEKDTR